MTALQKPSNPNPYNVETWPANWYEFPELVGEKTLRLLAEYDALLNDTPDEDSRVEIAAAKTRLLSERYAEAQGGGSAVDYALRQELQNLLTR